MLFNIADKLAKPTLGLIWAQSANRIIGKKGKIPWNIPEDLAYFKDMTGSDAVIMGRKTWESLPESKRPLPGRRNIVLSNNPDYQPAGAEVYSSLDAALLACDDEKAVWVIGGEKLYREAIEIADILLVTHVTALVEDGDATSPFIDYAKWYVSTESEPHCSRISPHLQYKHTRYNKIPLVS